jgi:FKBP-type peptidyl-prolyl cis-trans isomerase
VTNPEPPVTAKNGLVTQVLVQGTGDRVAQRGDKVTVHYVGTLAASGETFDSSRKRDTPFSFKLGGRMVIDGWEQGIEGMKVGELRKLTVPPMLGYGMAGAGPIPPNATLLFEVELLELR